MTLPAIAAEARAIARELSQTTTLPYDLWMGPAWSAAAAGLTKARVVHVGQTFGRSMLAELASRQPVEPL